MDIFCTVRSATDNGDNVECSVFMLRRLNLKPGVQLDQRRDTGEGPSIVASWEFVSQTDKTLVLKKGDLGAYFIEQSDGFYANVPEDVIAEHKTEEHQPMNQDIASQSVLIFAGKNWKLASPKKWVSASILLDETAHVGELSINGKQYDIFKLNEGFAAKEKAS